MRTVALLTGCLLLAILPIALYASFGGGSFTVHMILHMGIVAVAAPLLAYGLLGTGIDIPRKTVCMTPVLASVIELIVVWLWHVPALRAMADARSDLLRVSSQRRRRDPGRSPRLLADQRRLPRRRCR